MKKTPLTEFERALNTGAIQDLIPGSDYQFNPPITATGFPVGGPSVCEPQELQFDTGYYLGYQDEKHVFQGKPINDHRKIDNRLRECYFHVDFVGGSKAIRLENTSDNDAIQDGRNWERNNPDKT